MDVTGKRVNPDGEFSELVSSSIQGSKTGNHEYKWLASGKLFINDDNAEGCILSFDNLKHQEKRKRRKHSVTQVYLGNRQENVCPGARSTSPAERVLVTFRGGQELPHSICIGNVPRFTLGGF